MPSRLRRLADEMPEVLFTVPGDNAQAQRYSRLKSAGQIRQLYRGVFTTNLRATEADVIARNWSAILGHLIPGAVMSHRSAIDARPEQGVVYYTRAAGAKKISLPGLEARGLINLRRGAITSGVRQGANDIPYNGLFIASQARAFLENLTRDKRLAGRQFPRTGVENRLEQILALRGEAGLNTLRDDAREVAAITGLTAEFTRLEGMIGALLGTRAVRNLTTAQALARAAGRPYDAQRLMLVEKLAAELRNFPFARVPESAKQGAARTLFAFAESYFSNYIEGTTFTIDEAEEIIFHDKLIALRTADSHDIKGTFDAALRDPFYSRPPQSADTFCTWIRNANAKVLAARPEVVPGEWKTRSNRAGSTLFVAPALVEGTLRQAWMLLSALPHPVQQALLAMFVVAEVHPFTDGNGRTARLMMNCWLSAAGQCRVIVPTVYREDYLLSLKALSHNADATGYIRAMRLCQAWTAELNFDAGLPQLDAQLQRCNAKQDDVTKHRLLSPLTGLAMRVPE